MERYRYDVIVIGGGPVGMGLAIELGQRGVGVCVVERYHSPQPVPKGQNLTQRTMEHFMAWGCEDAVRAARIVPPDYAIGGMTSYGTLLSGYNYDWLQRELVRPYYYTDNERLPQYATEAVLRARAAEIGCVDILYGWSGHCVEEGEECATVFIRRRHGGESRHLQGRYVVGCDGSNSAIRKSAGISQTRSDHDRLMVLLVFRSTRLHELLKRYPGKQFYCVLHPDLDGYWLFFGRVDLGSTWFFHAPVPAGTTKDNFDFRAYLHRAVGERFDVEFEHVGFWDLRIAVADQYRKGHVFLSGDAAHSHPPYGGYGINTGFEDARNLGWKLAARLEGWGGANLLDSYEAERRPVFVSTADDFIDLFIREDREFLKKWNPEHDRVAFEKAWSSRYEGSFEVNSFEPNYDGSPVVFGNSNASPSAKGRHEFEARAGHHLAPAELGEGRKTWEAFGEGFTLFDLEPDEEWSREFAETSARMGAPVKIVRSPDSPARNTLNAGRILVRPDHFVAWTDAKGDRPPAEILDKVTGRS